MDLLNLLNKVKIQTLSFEKHPIAKLDDEMKIHYLNGLSLVAIADGSIHEKEKEYLTLLINSFGLSDEILDSFIEFAQNPDEKAILEMMKAFTNRDIKYNFIIDAMNIAYIDEEYHENEKAVIQHYFEMFKFREDEIKDLKDIYDMFKKQDGNRLLRYFGKQDKYDTYLIKKELFEYLLDYYNIDMAYELQENEKRVLDFEFFKPTFSSGGLDYGATEIMVKPVNNEQFCIFLNSAFVNKEIEFNGDGNLADSETKDLLMNLEMSDIKFENNEFIVKNREDEEKKVTGVTYVAAKMFIEWVSKYNNAKYKLPTFTYDRIYMDSFINPIFEEFYFANHKTAMGYPHNKYKIANNTFYKDYYLNIPSDRNANKTSLASFRLMKLPEKEK